MKWLKHLEIRGKHAFLSPSKHTWLNYDRNKLATVFRNQLAKYRGTKIHAFAANAIDLGQKLPRSPKTLNMYVNDAIGFRLDPEVDLFYSNNCFGTADAIGFDGHTLRIHDLKTGVVPAHMQQLRTYAAIFCLQYKVEPKTIDIVLRIYQNNQIVEEVPDPQQIKDIMIKIQDFDKLLDQIRKEEGIYDIDMEVTDDAG